jgi:hypothetical protein
MKPVIALAGLTLLEIAAAQEDERIPMEWFLKSPLLMMNRRQMGDPALIA